MKPGGFIWHPKVLGIIFKCCLYFSGNLTTNFLLLEFRVTAPQELMDKLWRESAHYGVWYEKTQTRKDTLRLTKETLAHKTSLLTLMRVFGPVMEQGLALLSQVAPDVHKRWTTAFDNFPDQFKNVFKGEAVLQTDDVTSRPLTFHFIKQIELNWTGLPRFWFSIP